MCNLVIIYAMFFPQKDFFFLNKSVSLLLQGKEKKELEKQQRWLWWVRSGLAALSYSSWTKSFWIKTTERQFETTSKYHFHQEEWQRTNDLIIDVLARVLRNCTYIHWRKVNRYTLCRTTGPKQTLFKRHILGTHTLDTCAPMHKDKCKGMSLTVLFVEERLQT